jgi:hypothetical protein
MSFNLDISSYNIGELEELFSLSPPYSSTDIKRQSDIITKNIQNDKNILQELKQKTIQFINEGTEILYINIGISPTQLHTQPKTPNLPSITDIYPQTPYAPVPIIGGEHDIQASIPIKYTLTNTQDYFRGTLNPIQKRVIRKNLNIDTRFRDNYSTTSSSNFSILLPTYFNNVLSMLLTSIEIPNSFYVISKQYGNNCFSISAGNERIIYIIPDGNYSNGDIMDFLNNYAVNNGYTPSTHPMLYYMSFVVNIIGNSGGNGTSGTGGTGQVIIGVSPSYPAPEPFLFNVNFNIDINGYLDEGTPLQMKCGWLLGFRVGIYENSYSYVSEGMIDLYGPRYCYLAINDYNNNVNNDFYGAFNSSVLNKNILARISIPNSTSNMFNIYNWNDMNLLSYPRQYFGPVNIQRLGIQLLDEYGRPIYLNNMDFSFCLTFETAYDI